MLSEATLTSSVYLTTGQPATYTPAVGAAASLTVIPEWQSASFGEIVELARQDAPTFRVRLSQLADPARGDQITYATKTYKVESWERVNESEWRLYVRR